jgi:hypothetical protein
MAYTDPFHNVAPPDEDDPLYKLLHELLTIPQGKTLTSYKFPEVVMHSEIRNVLALSKMATLALKLIDLNYPRTAKVLTDLIEIYLTFMISKDRGRAREITDALGAMNSQKRETTSTIRKLTQSV